MNHTMPERERERVGEREEESNGSRAEAREEREWRGGGGEEGGLAQAAVMSLLKPPHKAMKS